MGPCNQASPRPCQAQMPVANYELCLNQAPGGDCQFCHGWPAADMLPCTCRTQQSALTLLPHRLLMLLPSGCYL